MSVTKRETVTFSVKAEHSVQIYPNQKDIYIKGYAKETINNLSQIIPAGAPINIKFTVADVDTLKSLVVLLLDKEMKFEVFKNENVEQRMIFKTMFYSFRVIDCFE